MAENEGNAVTREEQVARAERAMNARPDPQALLEQFRHPKGGNLTETVEEFLDLCDVTFLGQLQLAINDAGGDSEEGAYWTQVMGEINQAMQRRLVAADGNLREILILAPDLKKMEAKLKSLMKAGNLDTAFNVMLNMNLAQAQEDPRGQNAVIILTHLNTIINEMQDKTVSPTIRLARKLLRTEDSSKREYLLRTTLVLEHGLDGIDPTTEMLEGRGYPKPEVPPDSLRKELSELRGQAQQMGQGWDAGVADLLEQVGREIDKVVEVYG